MSEVCNIQCFVNLLAFPTWRQTQKLPPKRVSLAHALCRVNRKYSFDNTQPLPQSLITFRCHYESLYESKFLHRIVPCLNIGYEDSPQVKVEA
jgi:hypothetical protein